MTRCLDSMQFVLLLALLAATPLAYWLGVDLLLLKDTVLAALGVLVGLAYGVRIAAGQAPVPVRAPLLAPIAILLAVAALSLFASPVPREGLVDLLRWAVLFIVYLALLDSLNSIRRWTSVATTYLAVCGVLCLLAWLQAAGPLAEVLPSTYERQTVSATLGHNNAVALLLALALPPLLMQTLLGNRNGMRAAGGALMLVFTVMVLMTQSRSVWVALAVAALALPFLLAQAGLRLHREQVAVPAMAAIIALILVVALFAGLLAPVGLQPPERFDLARRLRDFSFDSLASTTQLSILGCCTGALRRVPVLGSGLGSFPCVFPDLQAAYFAEHPDSILRPTGLHAVHAHNEFLHAMIEMGLVGAACAIVLAGCALMAVWRRLPRLSPDVLRPAVTGCAAGVLVFAVYAGLMFPFHVAPEALAGVVVLALVLARVECDTPAKAPVAFGWQRWAAAVIALALPVGAYLVLVPRLVASYHERESGASVGRKDFAGAREHLSAALRAAPWSGAVRAKLALLLMQDGEYEEALQQLDRAYETYRHRTVSSFRAAALEQLGRTEEALMAQEQATAIVPRDEDALDTLVRAYLRAGRLSRAAETARWMEKWNPGAIRERIYVEAYNRCGERDYAAGRALGDLLVAAVPEDADYRNLCAEAAYRLGEVAAAYRHWDAANAEAPWREDIAAKLALLHLARGEVGLAAARLRFSLLRDLERLPREEQIAAMLRAKAVLDAAANIYGGEVSLAGPLAEAIPVGIPPERPVGLLAIEVNPANATIVLDATSIGPGPLRSGWVPIGVHRVYAYAPDCEPAARHVIVSTIAPASVAVVLAPHPHPIRIPAAEGLPRIVRSSTDTVEMALIDGAYLQVGEEPDVFTRQVEALRRSGASTYRTRKRTEPPRTAKVVPFYLDRVEVTNARLARVFPHWEYPAGADDVAAGGVPYAMAVEYARQVGKRLPTEHEWLLAARGAAWTLFPWGSTWLRGACNGGEYGREDGFAGPAPVGSFPQGASPNGVLDLFGNVWEWLEIVDREAWGDLDYGLLRGGGFDVPIVPETIYDRRGAERTFADRAHGFRCAMDASNWRRAP